MTKKDISHIAATLLIKGTTRNIVCNFQGEHYSASCGKIKDGKLLRREGRCFLCLSSDHRTSNCISNRRSWHCGRRHHQSLCEQNRCGQGNDKKMLKLNSHYLLMATHFHSLVMHRQLVLKQEMLPFKHQ